MGKGDILPFLKKKRVRRVWLNDLDYGVSSFWKAVYYYPLKLLNKMKNYEPEHMYVLRDVLDGLTSTPKGVEDITDIALTKLALQMSATGNLKTCWKTNKMAKNIAAYHNLLKKSEEVRITSWDFEQILTDKKCDGLIYLNPPQFNEQNRFSEGDHWRLSEHLFYRSGWVMCYDDHPKIRNFYSFAQIHEHPDGLVIVN